MFANTHMTCVGYLFHRDAQSVNFLLINWKFVCNFCTFACVNCHKMIDSRGHRILNAIVFTTGKNSRAQSVSQSECNKRDQLTRLCIVGVQTIPINSYVFFICVYNTYNLPYHGNDSNIKFKSGLKKTTSSYIVTALCRFIATIVFWKPDLYTPAIDSVAVGIVSCTHNKRIAEP